MRKLRYWLISKLLRDDEKYVLVMAIDSRIQCMIRNMVESRSMDFPNTETDLDDYRKFRDIFSTDLWR